MRQSSDSIGTLAAALAKAQAQLVNPEKTMVATIRPDGRGAAEQTFRYAPLSSGLDIVRKSLGQHEIAMVQATAIDHAAGTVNVTTTLAHSSGEWISSGWPVCSLDDMASPKRMGAALTYARRYALFALVGIAGEDDLDAPDLNTPEPVGPTDEKPPLNPQSRSNGGRNHLGRKTSADRVTNKQVSSDNPRLKSQLSAVLRDQLVSELKGVTSTEDAAIWARRSLPARSSLSAEDARRLENAFQSRLARLEGGIDDSERRPSSSSGFIHNEATSLEQKGPETTRTSTIARIEESTHAHPQPRRVRDREHVNFVAGHPCLICGRSPADPHHLRFAQSRALGRKVSDEFTVPLCRGHHREVHRCGDEVAWWAKTGIDALGVANTLWRKTHPLLPQSLASESPREGSGSC
jgi:ERF superfamily